MNIELQFPGSPGYKVGRESLGMRLALKFKIVTL